MNTDRRLPPVDMIKHLHPSDPACDMCMIGFVGNGKVCYRGPEDDALQDYYVDFRGIGQNGLFVFTLHRVEDLAT